MTATATHLVPGASFSDERLAERRRTLGASEVPAVLGLDRHRSALDVWLEKTGQAPPFAGNEFTEWGLRMEPVIRQKVAETLGVEIALAEGTLRHPEHEWVSATPDGLLDYEGEPCVLEIKNKGERQTVYWGEPGTDAVPTGIAAQAYWQMFVTGRRRAIIAVLFGKSDFRLYHLPYHDEIAVGIYARCADFWQASVIGGQQPEITAGKAAADYLQRTFERYSEILRPATREEESLIAKLRTTHDKIKELKDTESLLQNQLKAAIGADAGIQGRAGRVTWKAPKGLQTAWKDVATTLGASLAPEVVEATIAQHSHPYERRFLPTFPKEA